MNTTRSKGLYRVPVVHFCTESHSMEEIKPTCFNESFCSKDASRDSFQCNVVTLNKCGCEFMKVILITIRNSEAIIDLSCTTSTS